MGHAAGCKARANFEFSVGAFVLGAHIFFRDDRRGGEARRTARDLVVTAGRDGRDLARALAWRAVYGVVVARVHAAGSQSCVVDAAARIDYDRAGIGGGGSARKRDVVFAGAF